MLQPQMFTGADFRNPQHKELLAQAQEKNQKHVEPLDVDYRLAGTVKIFNVGPDLHHVAMGGLGQFLIQGCPEGKPFSSATEIWKQYPEGKNDDMQKMSIRLLDGYRVAESIVSYGRFTDPTSDLRKFGVFVCGASKTVQLPDQNVQKILAGELNDFLRLHPGSVLVPDRKATSAAIEAARKAGHEGTNEEIIKAIENADLPTEQELEEANRRLNDWCMELVAIANGYYQSNNLIEIQKLHRWAAERTNNTGLPWVKGSVLMKKCEGCGLPVDPDAAICNNPNCGNVFKPEVVIARKLRAYRHLWDKHDPSYEGPDKVTAVNSNTASAVAGEVVAKNVAPSPGLSPVENRAPQEPRPDQNSGSSQKLAKDHYQDGNRYNDNRYNDNRRNGNFQNGPRQSTNFQNRNS